MNLRASFVPGFGIGRRIALLVWLVSLVILVLFAAVIIVQQRGVIADQLRSRAVSIAVSLQEITAVAVAREDYAALVDHSLQLLRGDPSIDFLIVTRQDGFSIIARDGEWRQEILPPAWRPGARTAWVSIGDEPLVGRRAFHYAQPFAYSGIPWGWMHVGLSLEAYDRSLRALYLRVGQLLGLCTLLSLAVSVGYARRFARPIRTLEGVVGRVAEGDLSVRAIVETGDEIERLGGAFNRMTESLLQRDRMVQSVRFAAERFVGAPDWKAVLPEVLAHLGSAVRASRAEVHSRRVRSLAHGPVTTVCSWSERESGAWPAVARGSTPPWLDSADPVGQAVRRGGMASLVLHMASPRTREYMEAARIQSVIVIPILVEGGWWGLLTLEESGYERLWTAAEQDSLRAVAHMFGTTVAQQCIREALVEAKGSLERRVQERTQELQAEVEARQAALAKLAETQDSLMEVSRKSGMAEIATGVLHNVGNVLNSVNVSTGMLQDRLRASRIETLRKAVDLISRHEADLGAFFSKDQRGRAVPGFLRKLADHLSAEREMLLEELARLAKSVEHIKQIVATQQNYAKGAGLIEVLPPAQLFEDAMQINAVTLQKAGVEIVREFPPVPPVRADRHKVLQILINLISNAKHAVLHHDGPLRRIVLRVAATADGRIRLEVQDTGVGIAPENLGKIFRHGFTTKKDGHGFGLHSAANSAQGMDGSLTVASDGPGCGTTFTLTLPAAEPLAAGPAGAAEAA